MNIWNGVQLSKLFPPLPIVAIKSCLSFLPPSLQGITRAQEHADLIYLYEKEWGASNEGFGVGGPPFSLAPGLARLHRQNPR